MNEKRIDDYFPIGSIVSADVMSHIQVGKWERIYMVRIPQLDTEQVQEESHTLDISAMPSHSFGCKQATKGTNIGLLFYKRIE